MPAEHREIVLSVPEIIVALVILSGESGILPIGRIQSLKITEKNGGIVAVLTITSKAGRKKVEHEVKAEQLGAALIRLCESEKVPLARKAAKRLARHGEGLALHLDLTEKRVPLNSQLSRDAIETNARAAF
ncbi:MAG: hypothetical protein EXQ98_05750 [Alphaproteobacteria bacterium]|nr:hypothetical protein [Alphaproteobacteria bacterium]